MTKPTEDYWITVRFKSNGVKERTFTGSDDNVLLCNFVKDNFINAKETLFINSICGICSSIYY